MKQSLDMQSIILLFLCTYYIVDYKKQSIKRNLRYVIIPTIYATVPLDLNFTYARAQKATARNIHGNALE